MYNKLFRESPWACVIKVCSNGGAPYIFGEIIAKNNLNTVNLLQTFENLLLLNPILRYCTHKVLGMCY